MIFINTYDSTKVIINNALVVNADYKVCINDSISDLMTNEMVALMLQPAKTSIPSHLLTKIFY